MAQILQFKHDTQLARAVAQRSAIQCEVIIFPGVRYERWDDPATEALDEQLTQLEDQSDEENHSDRDSPGHHDVRQKRRTKKSRSSGKARDILVLPD